MIEFLDHSGDVKFKVTAQTLEEVFNQSTHAFTQIHTKQKVKESRSHTITIVSDSLKQLLFDFVDELISVIEVEHLLPAGLHNIEIGENTITATIVGDDVSNYVLSAHVKAPTYHQLSLEKNQKWEAVVVVDL